MISLLIAEDHKIVRNGLKRILTAHGDIEVAAEAANGDEALALVRANDYDIAMIDMSSGTNTAHVGYVCSYKRGIDGTRETWHPLRETWLPVPQTGSPQGLRSPPATVWPLHFMQWNRN